jgi:hypothetical protein
MLQPLTNDVIQYVENNISSFHKKRLNKIETLRLKEVLQKKISICLRQKTFKPPLK